MGSCSCTGSCASNCATKAVYACAGASNVGKYSYELSIMLHERGTHAMSCAVGVGADICGFTSGAKEQGKMNLLIDGCPVGCLKAMFDNKGIDNYDHVVLTELGIKKEGNFVTESAVLTDLVQQIDEMGV